MKKICKWLLLSLVALHYNHNITFSLVVIVFWEASSKVYIVNLWGFCGIWRNIFLHKRVFWLFSFSKIIWGKVFKNGPSKICGRQRYEDLKWYGLLRQTISLQIFKKLSSSNFTWSILEYFFPYQILTSFNITFSTLSITKISRKRIYNMTYIKSFLEYVIEIMFLVYTTIYRLPSSIVYSTKSLKLYILDHVLFHKQLRFWVQSEFAKYLTPKFMEAFLPQLTIISLISFIEKEPWFLHIKSYIFCRIFNIINSEVAVLRCSTKQVFFKILKNSQETTCTGATF